MTSLQVVKCHGVSYMPGVPEVAHIHLMSVMRHQLSLLLYFFSKSDVQSIHLPDAHNKGNPNARASRSLVVSEPPRGCGRRSPQAPVPNDPPGGWRRGCAPYANLGARPHTRSAGCHAPLIIPNRHRQKG